MHRKRKKKKSETTNEVEKLTTESEEKEGETEKLKAKLEVINSKPEVIGYILRNSRSATIDAKDPSKIINYAILSSSTIEAAEELSNTFKLGEFNRVIVEGIDANFLSVSIGENSISVFMNKKADIEKIYKQLL